MKTIVSKKLLKRWAEMTECNLHSEVRAAIADYFSKKSVVRSSDYEKIAGNFLIYSECAQLDNIDISNRSALTRYMLSLIAKEFGNTLAEKIEYCL